MTNLHSDPQHVDDRRAHELYHYFQPENPALLPRPSSSPPSLLPEEKSSPNLVLTAIAQLAAVKLGLQRAIISVVDRKTLYVVAEATQSLHLGNNLSYKEDGDGLWIGCSQGPVTGTLCERTVALPPASSGKHPFFIVDDLQQHETFKKIPCVFGPPYFRFYAGTPITTAKGINIGSFYVIDPRPNRKLTSNQQETLGVLSEAVVEYLETSRQAFESDRLMKLLSGLNAFVRGSSSFEPEISSIPQPPMEPSPAPLAQKSRSPSPKHSSIGSRERRPRRMSDQPQLQPAVESKQKRSPPALHRQASSQASDALSSEWVTGTYHTSNSSGERDEARSSSRRWTFQRAANVMRESLDLGDNGGVVLVDANSSGDQDSDNEVEVFNDYTGKTRQTGTVLAMSTKQAPFLDRQKLQSSSPIMEIEQRLVRRLLMRFPKGGMWYFHEDGSCFTSDEDYSENSDSNSNDSFNKSTSPDGRGNGSYKSDIIFLKKHFPNASRIIFSPLWDSLNSRWFGGCFCWSGMETRVFSPPVELGSVFGFGSALMVEYNRLESLESDRRKGDFLSSISHELRSPLHGILAATEFLADQAVTGLPRSLLETIRSCGQTLLDTFEQILDFSKINAFERKRRDSKWLRLTRSIETALPSKSVQSLNILKVADVVCIAEEVVESICFGRQYSTALDPSSYTAWKIISAPKEGTDGAAMNRGSPTEITIEVEPDDWLFVIEPGALRRIIMNIFGNALKYTSEGFISLMLELEKNGEATTQSQSSETVILTVSDTGKGITDEYLRSHLYTPFSQEDSLAPGTGLGLSIVKSIVRSLNGSIKIRSRVGAGTVVKVHIPLTRPRARGNGSSSADEMMTVSSDTSHGDDVKFIRKHCRNKKVAVIDALNGRKDGQTSIQSVSKYFTRWFDFEKVLCEPDQQADIFLVDETRLPEALSSSSTAPMLVLCRGGFDRSQALVHKYNNSRRVESLMVPCGPYKLAKMVRAVMADPVSPPPSNPLLDTHSIAQENPPVMEYMSTKLVDESSGLKNDAGRDARKPSGNLPTVLNQQAQGLSPVTSLQPQGQQSNTSSSGDINNSPPTFSLPMSQVSSRTSETKSSPDGASHQQTSLPSRSKLTTSRAEDVRVLLVEDNPINLKLLASFLSKRNPAVLHTSGNGKEALEAVENMPSGYDFIFMDISMPVMNGFEATRAIRALENERGQTKPAIIIALTGLGSDRDITQAHEAGVNLFLTKPVSFKVINKLLDDMQREFGETSPAKAQ